MPTTPVLRIVGPPGSGKSLLITSLTEELRRHGIRTASAVLREGGATIIGISTGSRIVMEQPLEVARLSTVIATIDPTVRLVLAEGYDEKADDTSDDTSPAVELRPREHAEADATSQAAPFAIVISEEIAASFAQHGPGPGIEALVARIRRELLDETVEDPQPSAETAPGLIARLRQKLRSTRLR